MFLPFNTPLQERTQMSQTCDVNQTNEIQQATVQPTTLVRPRVDMYETDASYLLRAEMPGVDESKVDVQIERQVLTISAEVELPTPEGHRPVYGDVSKRRYERAFKLADDIDVTNVDAAVKNGLLTLTLPKVRPSVTKVAVKKAD
jgi:HSP20 family protein